MARPKTARLQTAYDLGHEHGRSGSRPSAADDVIGGNPEMQQAYDDGLRDGTDSLDSGAASTSRHRARPTSGSTPRSTGRAGGPSSEDRLGAEADAHSRRQRSSGNGSTARFSHPLHWGTGARGHVVGRPTLRPPSGFAMRDWTGFGFGLFLYALGAAYINNGPGGPTMWLKAKFINDTRGPDQAVGAPFYLDSSGNVHAGTPPQGTSSNFSAGAAENAQLPPRLTTTMPPTKVQPPVLAPAPRTGS